MRTSYSQNSMYIMCPKAWYFFYEMKLKSPEEGASLYFGSAIDKAVEKLLNGDKDYLDHFEKNMIVQYHFGKEFIFFDNPNITYSHSDFDKDILLKEDLEELYKWAKDLNLLTKEEANKLEKAKELELRNKMSELYTKIAKIKKNPYKKLKDNEKTFFNRASWLSLKRKGYILIEAFKNQFMPKIKKVLATQKQASIKDERTGDSIQGYIDMVLEIEGYDKPIIFDLKTAARPYDDEQLEHSTQLALYAGMKGADFKTNLVGYVVLCKNIQKDKTATCKKCGYVKNSSHRTCNNKINGKRCGGEWDEKIVPNPIVQVMVKSKTQEEINQVFTDVGNIISAMKQKIIYKDTSKCNNWYGGRCQFYNACHKNDFSGLVKK